MMNGGIGAGNFMATKILIVDDDQSVRETYRAFLSKYGFTFLEAANGVEALAALKRGKVDLVLTDNQMPEMDGLTLCETVKKTPELAEMPVIIISARLIKEEDAILGYKLGADDYIAKPVSVPMLRAKVLAVLNRYKPLPHNLDMENPTVATKHGIKVDPVRRAVSVHGDSVDLTRKEFDLLIALLSANGRILSNHFLLEEIWGYDLAQHNDPRTVVTHISTLRKKLGAKVAKHIVSITGFGYQLV